MAIPPPPFSNIAGTSAIVGKYNQQESLANADGNARPGQQGQIVTCTYIGGVWYLN